MECRCCGEDKSIEYLDLGMQPLANSYHRGEELPRYPLKVMLCTNCFLSYLSETVNPDELFKHYLYVSGTTHTLRKHWKELAADAVARVSSDKPLRVCDIASNDGSGLEQFRDIGCEVLGIDPAINLREFSKAKGIDTIVDYWRKGLVANESFDIITAANVFAHVENVYDFLDAAKLALKSSGIIILEFPYAREMIENNYFDQIYHEHLQYYLSHALYKLFDRIGLKVDDIILSPIHGGSIRFFLKKNREDHCDKLYEMIQAEGGAGLLKTETYLNYGAKVDKIKNDFVELVTKLKNEGNKIVCYGASAKSSTALTYFRLSKEHFAYVVDDNKMKHDFFTPGTNIPIVPPDRLADEKDDLKILLTAWNFSAEIKKKVRDIRGHARDEFVFYVPDVHVE